MYRLLHSATGRVALVKELPAFLCGLAIAEIFFKFHSFGLEAASFLVVWYALGFLRELLSLKAKSRVEGEVHAG
ncbi:MAG: hypothetical protein DMG65_17910 [Candidatus Angelobacter sp. Gp1-AA117]|nr:MAG: hypothetical protein DMG65_17910 [Candidatus Angelobacter sp. Gp1-AA117]